MGQKDERQDRCRSQQQPTYDPRDRRNEKKARYTYSLFGFKYFFTETSINDEHHGDDYAIASSTNFDDAALSYGVGGGIDIKIHRGHRKSVFINVGARYLFGSEAQYLKEGSIERRNGQVFFTTERSETDILITQLGMTMKF